MTKEEIKIKLDEASKEYTKRFNSAPENMDYNQFQTYMAVAGNEVDRLSREYRLVKTPEMREHKNIGTLMTLEEFLEYVDSGGFIDYDGSGNYATIAKESDISIYPSDVDAGKVRKDFTHVVWYNR